MCFWINTLRNERTGSRASRLLKSAMLHVSIYMYAVMLVNVRVYASHTTKALLPWTILFNSDNFYIVLLYNVTGPYVRGSSGFRRTPMLEQKIIVFTLLANEAKPFHGFTKNCVWSYVTASCWLRLICGNRTTNKLRRPTIPTPPPPPPPSP